MADVETNKRNVVEYYELAFNEHQPEQAVERYVGSEYIQHNPQAPDGPEAFIAFVRAFPEISVDIRRVIGEGDLVVTHGVVKSTEDDPGTVAVDIFRLEDGKVVEHWDVMQEEVPASATASGNPMFTPE